MPPQATETTAASAAGFRYTPPSYLLKTKDENRPWKESVNKDEEEGDFTMRQEDRPSRRETQLDAHFQYRVQKKQSRYRNIVKGSDTEAEDAEEEKKSDDFYYGMEETIVLDSLEQVQQTQEAYKKQTQAREARKQRLSGTPEAKKPTASASSGDSQADSVRSMRAARLRTSLLQRTPGEIDMQTKLEERRQKQKEEELLLKQQKGQSPDMKTESLASVEEERRKLEQERRALEEAKREATIHLAKQWQKQQAQYRRRAVEQNNNTDSDNEEDDSLEEMLNTKPKKKSVKRLSRRKKGSSRRSNIKRSSTIDEFDFAFMDDFSHLLRESGLLSGCVGQCFGHEPDLIPNSEDSTSTGNPSVASPATSMSNTNPKKNEMNMIYAKYRE